MPVNNFKSILRGQVIEPNDRRYDEVRELYNAMIDKRPAMIVQCADIADVIASVRYARENNLLTAIRGGGHNGAGLGSCDGGLVIDLSQMHSVRIDPKGETVRVEGGCTWGDVDHATHTFGKATPSGIISTTGVGGLTLGGGVGHLTRKCGLTIDNLLEADLVLADGTVVTVGPRSHQDLYWAIRGGGGNFGVVTSFLFRLHNVHTVHAGPMLWEMQDAAAALKSWRDLILSAPEEINGFFAFLVVPPAPPFPEHLHHKTMAGVVWCCTTTSERADAALDSIRKAARPAFEYVGPVLHPALQRLFDLLYPKGLQWYWKADYVKDLPDEAINLHLKFGSAIPTMHSTMHLYPINGAAHRPASTDTAWAYRDANWVQVIVGVDPDPANNRKTIDWTREYWNALHPYGAGGAYVNFLFHDEGQERVKTAYRENYARLAAVKKQYDPANFFRVNQNIQPAA